MTLDDLRRQLDALNLPGDTPVVVAHDAEGNGYSPLATVADGLYHAHNTWSGGFYMTAAMRAASDDPDEWDEAPDGAVPAVFLWPTN